MSSDAEKYLDRLLYEIVQQELHRLQELCQMNNLSIFMKLCSKYCKNMISYDYDKKRATYTIS